MTNVNRVHVLLSRFTSDKLDRRRAPRPFRRRVGDIIEFMKGTIVCINKSNVTELCVDTRLVYRKPQLQSRERFDISILVGCSHCVAEDADTAWTSIRVFY